METTKKETEVEQSADFPTTAAPKPTPESVRLSAALAGIRYYLREIPVAAWPSGLVKIVSDLDTYRSCLQRPTADDGAQGHELVAISAYAQQVNCGAPYLMLVFGHLHGFTPPSRAGRILTHFVHHYPYLREVSHVVDDGQSLKFRDCIAAKCGPANPQPLPVGEGVAVDPALLDHDVQHGN